MQCGISGCALASHRMARKTYPVLIHRVGRQRRIDRPGNMRLRVRCGFSAVILQSPRRLHRVGRNRGPYPPGRAARHQHERWETLGVLPDCPHDGQAAHPCVNGIALVFTTPAATVQVDDERPSLRCVVTRRNIQCGRPLGTIDREWEIDEASRSWCVLGHAKACRKKQHDGQDGRLLHVIHGSSD